jgi:hypothetical protein
MGSAEDLGRASVIAERRKRVDAALDGLGGSDVRGALAAADDVHTRTLGRQLLSANEWYGVRESIESER